MILLILILNLLSLTLSLRFNHYNSYRYQSLLLSSSTKSIPEIPQSLPLGVIIATNNNLSEDQLEIIDDIIYTSSGQNPPVLIVSNNDLKLTLNNVLIDDKDFLTKRDHEISNDSNRLMLDVKNVPILLLSGFNREQVSLIIRAIKTWSGPTSGQFPRIAFALAVQPALVKTLKDLFNEILRDYSDDVKKIT